MHWIDILPAVKAGLASVAIVAQIVLLTRIHRHPDRTTRTADSARSPGALQRSRGSVVAECTAQAAQALGAAVTVIEWL